MEKYDRIISVVARLVDRHGTRNPYDICDGENITVRLMNLGLKQKAYSVRLVKKPYVVINQAIGRPFRKMLCAHELGHILLHPEEVKMIEGSFEKFKEKLTADTERDTHIFAAELLIEDDELWEYLVTTSADIYAAAREFFVPVEIMNVKYEIMEHKGYRIHAPFCVSVRFLRESFDEWFFDDDYYIC